MERGTSLGQSRKNTQDSDNEIHLPSVQSEERAEWKWVSSLVFLWLEVTAPCAWRHETRRPPADQTHPPPSSHSRHEASSFEGRRDSTVHSWFLDPGVSYFSHVVLLNDERLSYSSQSSCSNVPRFPIHSILLCFIIHDTNNLFVYSFKNNL